MDFWNKVTKEHRKSIDEVKLSQQPDADNWIATNNKELPNTPAHFWKLNGNKIEEMTAEEKTAATPKPYRGKYEIFHDIFTSIPAGEHQELFESFDKHASFLLAIDMGRVDIALQILEIGKTKNNISAVHYAKVKAALEK